MDDITLTAGPRLQLRFFRRGDRWQHIVECRESERLIWQLESAAADSIETAADANWPPSPPFQSFELHTEPNGRQFALLVGMAGSSHWSASIEADADRERFMFDVACRVKAEPKWLGSCYAGAPVVDATIPLVELVQTAPTVDPVTIESAGKQIVVRVSKFSGGLPRTVRWKYAISAAPGS